MSQRVDPLEKARREGIILEMRRQRCTWDEIGAELGISGKSAYDYYERLLANNPLTGMKLDEHRLEATEMIDLAVNRLLKIAVDPAVSARSRIESWNALRLWEERRAKLLGLDAPSTVQIVTIDALDEQIAKLEAELEIRSRDRDSARGA